MTSYILVDKLNVVISILQQLLLFLCPYTLHCWVCSCSSMELPQVHWKMVSANKSIIGLIHSRERVTRYTPIIKTLPQIRHLYTCTGVRSIHSDTPVPSLGVSYIYPVPAWHFSLSTYQSTISVTVHSCSHGKTLHLQCVAIAIYPYSMQVSMLC